MTISKFQTSQRMVCEAYIAIQSLLYILVLHISKYTPRLVAERLTTSAALTSSRVTNHSIAWNIERHHSTIRFPYSSKSCPPLLVEKVPIPQSFVIKCAIRCVHKYCFWNYSTCSIHHFFSLHPIQPPYRMASPARFLSLLPTEHVFVASTTDKIANALDIPVIQKTRRSSSTTTEESTLSPRGAVDEAVVPAEVKTRFLRLGN